MSFNKNKHYYDFQDAKLYYNCKLFMYIRYYANVLRNLFLMESDSQVYISHHIGFVKYHSCEILSQSHIIYC